MHEDPIAAVAKDGDDEVDVDTAAVVHTGILMQAAVVHTGPPPPSLRAMMETIMTTQAAHGQLLYGFFFEVAALRADLVDYRRAIPRSPPSDS